MRPYSTVFLSPALALLLGLGALAAPAPADAAYSHLAMQTRKVVDQRNQLSPQEAAARARAKYGGKVLKVKREGGGYKVRLLLESGRVITVTIRG